MTLIFAKIYKNYELNKNSSLMPHLCCGEKKGGVYAETMRAG